jgi:hypothetical protein
MTIRKRNDSIKPGCGIDGTEGENFTKRRTDPWDSNPRGNYLSPKGAGVYQDKDASFLTNKNPNDDFEQQGKYTLAGGARDIFDEVEGQSSDSGNRAVRSRGQD